MSQQINLFNPLYRRKTFSCTSAAALLGGVMALVMAGAAAGALERHRADRLESQALLSENALSEARAHRDKVSGDRAVEQPARMQEARIAALQSQLDDRQQIVDALQSGAIGTTAGFSEYMRAFSRQRMDGLWLTGFDIAAGGKELMLRGRTLGADLVPAYLAGLNREVPMQGRQFASMLVTNPALGSEPKDSRRQNMSPQRPGYLDFALSSGALADQRALAVQPERPATQHADVSPLFKLAVNAAAAAAADPERTAELLK